MKKAYDYLIVGAGLFGSVFAREAVEHGKKCLVIDKRLHTGGNIYCENVDGINVHEYGAHIFHTDNKRVWQYVNNLVEFNRYTNSPLAKYGDKIYNLPFNMNTFNMLWGTSTPVEAREKIDEQRKKYADIEPANLEEQALKLCGDDIYRLFIKGYTEKQWGRSATELPAFIIKRIPFRFTYDNNYFNDAYQGIPIGGYNRLTDALLKGIEVKTGVNYFEDRPYWDSLAENILFTGCIDEFFDFRFGRLEYRSLRFEHERMPISEYPADFTGENEPYYPINDTRNTELFGRYKVLADETVPNVLFGGRLAQYAYFDMDDTVEAALRLAEQNLKK